MKKIILCGYDWAGCKALELLNKNKNQIYVYTHPDRPHDPSLWQYASELKIPSANLLCLACLSIWKTNIDSN